MSSWVAAPSGQVRHLVDPADRSRTGCGRVAAPTWGPAGDGLRQCVRCAAAAEQLQPAEPPPWLVESPSATVAHLAVAAGPDVPDATRARLTTAARLADAIAADPTNASLWRQYREALAEVTAPAGDDDAAAAAAIVAALRGDDQ